MLFVVHMSEDGDASVKQIDNLNEWIKEDFEGCTPPKFADPSFGNYGLLDLNDIGGKYLVIKGEVVVPKPVQVVTEYEEP
jgi:hypothetical protein